MIRRTKLRWTELPQHSLRDGLACHAGGARIMLLIGDRCERDEAPAVMDCSAVAEPDRQPAGRPR